MRVLFVAPPVFEGPGARTQPVVFTPLGLLSLGAIAEQLGHEVEILDLNILIRDHGLRWDHVDPTPAIDEIMKRRPDVVGFTTMSGTYPLTLRLVRALRQRDADLCILLGGPQASAVDLETMRAFPEVTAIVRGEAEGSLPAILQWCSGKLDRSLVPGLTYRNGDEIVRNPDPPLIEDLDTLPHPAWHLYPIHKVVPLAVDAGRGCPFECTFCTTNLFFRRKFRIKSPQRLIDECETLMRLTGERRFFFVHDLFTVNRRLVAETCEALIRADLGIEWRTSARVDLVDEELLSLLRRAGCHNLFFGIESASEDRQRSIKKRMKVRDVVPKLEAAIRLGIEPTASFIIGFPDEDFEDLWATAKMAFALVRAGVRDLYIHNLLPLPGAALTEQHRHELLLENRPNMFLRLPRADWELVRKHPDVFASFYVFPRRGPWALRQLMMRSADLIRSIRHRQGPPAVPARPVEAKPPITPVRPTTPTKPTAPKRHLPVTQS
jgi:radical SAM superfamily enzyme YgiQ (UPF0313 family)